MDRKSLLAIFHLYGTLRDGGREALQSALRGLGKFKPRETCETSTMCPYLVHTAN